MREIKFRAWDKVDRKIIEWEELRKIHASIGYINECEKTDGRVLMQYTGLKDKNGKEIYENDIIKLDNWEPKIHEVVFDRGAFCFRSSKDATFYNDCKYLEECEVIGNVFENPNLIKSGEGDIM